MANWIPENLHKAINRHLKNANQIKILLHVAEQIIRYKKEWDWTAESQFLKLLAVSKVTFYNHMKYLLTHSILFSRKEGRKRFYQVNQDYDSWGTLNEDAYRKIFPSKGKASKTNRLTPLNEKGNGLFTSLYNTLKIIYTNDRYSPQADPQLEIPLTKFQNWPTPLLKDPETLEKYIQEKTSSWEVAGFRFEEFLLIIVARKKLLYLHPDDIKNTIDQVNRLALKTKDDFWGYCQKALVSKWNERLTKMDLEIHDWRKKDEI